MRFCKVKDILDWIAYLHERLAREYDRLSDEAKDERVAMLLEYLADHQRRLQKTITRFETDAADKLLNTWFQGCPPLDLPESLDDLHQSLAGKSSIEVTKAAIKLHDQLIAIYRELEAAADVDSVREIFANLATLESHEKIRMVRDAQRLEDY